MLLMMGTNGLSRNQLKSVLFKKGLPTGDIDHNYKVLHDNLLSKTRNTPGMQLSIANQFFVAKWQVRRLKNKFRRSARRNYGCQVALMDFGDEPYTRNVINRWIEARTGRKIKEFIPDGMLDQLTFMILTNVVYFKGQWKSKFDPKKTTQRDFWMNENKKVMINMMWQKNTFKAGVDMDLKCKAVELPYKGDNISMVIILPNEKEGLPELEKKLSTLTFDNLVKRLISRPTELVLPKFKIKAKIDLKAILKGLGVTDIFEALKADFSHMVRSCDQKGDLYVSDAFHESVIEVNEEGSVAAAVSSIFMLFRSARPSTFEFVADHPFLFVIKDISSGTILFLGRYCNPEITAMNHINKISTTLSESSLVSASENKTTKSVEGAEIKTVLTNNKKIVSENQQDECCCLGECSTSDINSSAHTEEKIES
ncbi:leukocyte elastase inhibitor-like [Mytilus californianus]|uniref:leukocyte elastase inhibitor-like n=1 Tax=Mytilus californianus TaxID=6549 RepID=UPI00224575F1|nr:leukocyte elastase inhibitor-like [Mytilus californianus]